MVSADEIVKLYESSGYPSSKQFYKILQKEKIPVRLKDVIEFVSSQSTRQISRPGPKFEGKIVAFDINHKWFVDVISFVSRPVKTNDNIFKYVLIAQDVFSRKIWTRPMAELAQVTFFFAELLKESELFEDESNTYPDELTSDNGTEFTNTNFKALCTKYNIQQFFKTQLTHDIGTLDRAIGVWKQIIQRISNAKGGSWYSHSDKATSIYNETENGTTNAAPNEVSTDPIKRFDMRAQAGINSIHNTKLIQKRKDKLIKEGSFRIHQPNTKLSGLRQRIDSNQWSKDKFSITGFPDPGFIEDEFNRIYPTKLVLPIPKDSSNLYIKPEDKLKPFAEQLRNMLLDGNLFTTIKLTQAGKDMKKINNFTETLKKNKLSFKQFVFRYPEILKLEEGMIFPA